MPVSRFDNTFAALRQRGEKALVAFVTAGDPLPDRDADVICALADAGADDGLLPADRPQPRWRLPPILEE